MFFFGYAFQNQIALFLRFLWLVSFIKHAGQDQMRRYAGLQGDAGFEVALGFAPKFAAVSQLAKIHQQ